MLHSDWWVYAQFSLPGEILLCVIDCFLLMSVLLVLSVVSSQLMYKLYKTYVIFMSLCCMCNLYIKHFEMYFPSDLLASLLETSTQELCAETFSSVNQ